MSTNKRSGAIAGFVSTAVLTSSDGLFGDNVEEERITDAPAPREVAADYKPLYERLQEMKDKKDSEWKEKNNPFAPPKALDDEEIEFIRGLEEHQAASVQRKNAQHEQDLAQFLLARDATQKQSNSSNQPATIAAPKVPDDLKNKLRKEKDAIKPMVVVKVKRKAKSTDGAAEKKVKTDKQSKSTKPAAAAPAAAAKPVVAASALGLVAYGSDSDDSDSADDKGA
ncbi:TPA: hypothetical protein N0F65_005287 [Lagenidium giganteum]|uniref:FAM192A/Fyv6 N-terminal domain-containing protein n=1 Tax=Lagenidium giganteum TaxID=4803 RepID=A0AAV2YZ80_9STRA|nr:TPA: hypothetical protein N0F65_005287 [Lagenidium giganteum]